MYSDVHTFIGGGNDVISSPVASPYEAGVSSLYETIDPEIQADLIPPQSSLAPPLPQRKYPQARPYPEESAIEGGAGSRAPTSHMSGGGSEITAPVPLQTNPPSLAALVVEVISRDSRDRPFGFELGQSAAGETYVTTVRRATSAVRDFVPRLCQPRVGFETWGTANALSCHPITAPFFLSVFFL
jgi:hypothetical protein